MFFVGTYTNGDSEGIYRCRFDPESGALELLGHTGGVRNPSFLVADTAGRFLYAVGETADFQGMPSGSVHAFRPSGSVHAFRIEPQTGTLQPINAVSSGGAGPCHVSMAADERFVLVANYGGGSVAVFPVYEDGGLGGASDVVQHEGSGPNPTRQEGPHAHCVVSAGAHVLAADLGLDRVLIYRLTEDGQLEPGYQPAAVAPGAGPRHIAFHPSGAYLYVINELNSTVTAFSYDGEDGTLVEMQTLSTIPRWFDGVNHPADLHVHPDGGFLYGSNRGHDSIVVYPIDPDSGMLDLPIQHVSTGGASPRHFRIHPLGRFLLAANQQTNTIEVFDIERETGRLAPTGHSLSLPSPVCIHFL